MIRASGGRAPPWRSLRGLEPDGAEVDGLPLGRVLGANGDELFAGLGDFDLAEARPQLFTLHCSRENRLPPPAA